jgi:hypothetical protein
MGVVHVEMIGVSPEGSLDGDDDCVLETSSHNTNPIYMRQ